MNICKQFQPINRDLKFKDFDVCCPTMMRPMDDTRMIGLGLTAFGALFTFLGVLMFFDRGFLAIGNLLFIAGVAVTIGIQNTGRFVRKHVKGSVLFLGGVVLVLMGWTWIGFIVETYGFWLLFKGFIPTALTLFRRVPVLGKILDLPILKSVINRVAPMQTLPV